MSTPEISAAAGAPKPLTAAEIKANPAYKHSQWVLKPTSSGKYQVSKDRGGYSIAYEVHGTGPIKTVWIMGLGAYKEAWQRQTRHFGHTSPNDTTYSLLLIDNRGIGDSSIPFMRYSTSSMATDVHDISQHIGWTEPRSLHVLGVSMGGMIAQEFAYLYPNEIASLCLLSTAAQVKNTVGYFEHLRSRINMFMPKSLDKQLAQAKHMLFAEKYLSRPDEIAQGEDSWPTNGDRFAAQEVHKRNDPIRFTRLGFMMQAIAAGWHAKSPKQLGEIAENVGRERILVMHGSQDRMLTPPHYTVLMDGLGEVTGYYKEGLGHVIGIEDMNWFHETVEGFWKKTIALPAV